MVLFNFNFSSGEKYILGPSLIMRRMSILFNQSQVFTTTGQKYDRYMTTSQKIRLQALKCAKLEHFKVKKHRFAENLPI